MTTTQTGKMGERIARRFCAYKKWSILHTNWRSGRGEIDIIARDRNSTIFIEVKYRRSKQFGEPEESLTRHKQHMLRQTIAAYLMKHPTNTFRIDVLAISETPTRPQIKHIQGVDLLLN